MADVSKLNPRALVQKGFDKALVGQYPIARAHVARLRRVHPDKTP